MRLIDRPIFRVVALLGLIALPVVVGVLGPERVVPFAAMPVVVLGFPLLMSLRDDSVDPGPESDDDDGSNGGGGGNRRPDRGPITPSGPTGELPLQTSTPGRWRLRGREPQRVSDPGRRRLPHRAPARTPRRVPSGPHTR